MGGGKESRAEEDGRGKEMKVKTIVACVLLARGASGLAAPDGSPPVVLIDQGWVSGQYFLSLNEGQKTGLSAGIISGLLMSPLMGAPERGPEVVALSECTQGMSIGQLEAVIEKYLRDHPEVWNRPLGVSAVWAMRSVCPAFASATSDVSRRGVAWGRPPAPPSAAKP
jgi:hypothetical protein